VRIGEQTFLNINRLLLLTPGFSPVCVQPQTPKLFQQLLPRKKAVETASVRFAFCTRLKPGVNRSARLHSASIAKIYKFHRVVARTRDQTNVRSKGGV
jgi:hypothetical protein